FLQTCQSKMAAEEDMSTDETKTSIENAGSHTGSDIFSIEVLQIIKEAQQQHGLRHGDFQRYRGYCSRRIKRIRKSLHFPQGDKRRVNPKKVNIETVKDVRYLHLSLFSAERAWAYSMQLKAEANTELRKKFHMLARMKKAMAYAEEFYTLCEHEKCDARTKLESQAYRFYIKGSIEFELAKWKAAMESYNNRVAEIEPNIRYCAYNIGDSSALKDLQQMRRMAGGDMMSEELDVLLAQTREKQTATLSEVTWQGRTVPVKNEPVRLFLLSLQDSTQEVERAEGMDNKISIYESLLKQCIDAQQVLRDSLQEDQNFKSAQRGQPLEGQVSNQHYLHSYLTYIKLSKTIERNLLLIENMRSYLPGAQVEEGRKITKPQDLVRLYDIIIQNLGEIPNLNGIEDDESFKEEMTVRALGFKAFRCFYIAQSYVSARKWKEAIALYGRVLEYAQEAVDQYKRLARSSLYKAEQEHLSGLITEADGLQYSSHASAILDTEAPTEQMASLTVSNNKPLSERLEQYSEDTSVAGKKARLVKFPPDFKAIPCRPLFFDLALNHVEMPNLDAKAEQKKAASGITGAIKGWLWGGKK
ncbi:SRP68-like protein, partial [Mya arenaria]